MKARITAVAIILTLALCASGAAAKMKASMDFDQLMAAINNSQDGKGNFTGINSNIEIYGAGSGDVELVLEDSQGKRVYGNTYKCDESTGVGGTPSCFFSGDTGGKAAPYAVKSGEHTLRMLMGGQEIYALKFRFDVEGDDDSKSVHLSGDWGVAGSIELRPDGNAGISFFSGGPEACAHDTPEDVEALVYRNGEFFAKAQFEPGGFHVTCDLFKDVFAKTLFRNGADNLTVNIKSGEILKTDGDYEIKRYMDRKPAGVFGFRISGGKFSSAPPQGAKLQEALLPETLNVPETENDGEYWFYEK